MRRELPNRRPRTAGESLRRSAGVGQHGASPQRRPACRATRHDRSGRRTRAERPERTRTDTQGGAAALCAALRQLAGGQSPARRAPTCRVGGRGGEAHGPTDRHVAQHDRGARRRARPKHGRRNVDRPRARTRPRRVGRRHPGTGDGRRSVCRPAAERTRDPCSYPASWPGVGRLQLDPEDLNRQQRSTHAGTRHLDRSRCRGGAAGVPVTSTTSAAGLPASSPVQPPSSAAPRPSQLDCPGS
jgi:hypothetical protein